MKSFSFFDYAEEILQKPIAAAIAGSLIAITISYRQNRSAGRPADLLMLATGGITGFAASTYLGPGIASMIGADKFIGGVYFIIGLLAMNLAQWAWEFVRNGDLRDIAISWLKRRD